MLHKVGPTNHGNSLQASRPRFELSLSRIGCPSPRSGGQYCITVYVGGIPRQRPLPIGDVFEVSAKLVHKGTKLACRPRWR